MEESLLARWQAVARLPRDLEKIGKREERLPFLYEALRELLGMNRVRLFSIKRPMAELSAPNRNRLPFFEYIALQRQPVLVSNVENEGLALPREIVDWKFPTLLFIPLISREGALGVLVLASEEARELSGSEGELIDAAVPIVARTLEVDTLVAESERHVRHHKLVEGVDALMRDKGLVEILGSVVHGVHDALEVERTLIFVKRGPGVLGIATAIGCPYASAGHLDHDACGVLAAKVFKTRRTEIQNFNGIMDLGLTRPFCLERQVAAVPIATAERCFGVIEVFNRMDGKDFEGHQIELLERVAGRMALAIANAEMIEQIKQSGLNAVIGLAAALDAKDAYTASHSHNVGEYSYRIAAAMGIPIDSCERIRLAGILHDVGKIGIPDDVLNKPDKLTDAEFELIKSHPVKTGKILEHFHDLADVRLSAASHHERWDGFGYPERLKAEAIPLGGRIICLADAFDTLTSDRKYRQRVPMEFALFEMRRNAGRQFDAACVDGLFKALAELGEVDLNGNQLPAPEELERIRLDPPPPLNPAQRHNPAPTQALSPTQVLPPA